MKDFFFFLLIFVVLNLIWTLFWGYVTADFFWQLTLFNDTNPPATIARFVNAGFEIFSLVFALYGTAEILTP